MVMRFLSEEARQYLIDNGTPETVQAILQIMMEILIDFTLLEGATIESNIIFKKLAKALEYDIQMILKNRGDSHVTVDS